MDNVPDPQSKRAFLNTRSIAPGHPTAQDYFPALTGIRMVAATMVFFHHFNPFTAAKGGRWIQNFVAEWHVGVTIFFVLSGFLICHRYYEEIRSGKQRIWNYFVNRFGRIYPMYFIVTLLSFLPWICHRPLKEQWGVLLLNLSFLRGLFDDFKFTGAPAGWSLTVEEMFYVLFPLIILLSRKRKLFLQPLGLIAAGLALWAIFRHVPFHGFFGSLSFLFEFTFFGRCVEFYAGMALAFYLRRRRKEITVRKATLKTACGMGWIIICIALLELNRQTVATQEKFLFFETLINNFCLPWGVTLLLYGLITEQNFVVRLLSFRLTTLLGKASYSFYLVHNGFIFRPLYFGLGQKIWLVYIALQIISIALYKGIEIPLHQLIRRKFLIPSAPASQLSFHQAGEDTQIVRPGQQHR